MKKLLLVFLFFTGLLSAQILTGTVVNESDNPVQGVSVYVDGSSISTVSDASGAFSIPLSNMKTGNIVFKKESFETVIHPFNSNNLKKLKVIISKETVIEEIKLLHYTDKLYTRYIHRFLNEFIGADQQNVKIKNQRDILFAYDKEGRIIKAKAKKPLIIENKRLGYIIEYNLMSFNIDESQNMVTYTGTSFFKDMKGSAKNRLKWKAERLNAYYGSSLHFFRSAYQNRISEEGYIINRIVKILNPKYPNEEELQRLEGFRKNMREVGTKNSYIVLPDDISDIQTRKNNEKMFSLALTEHKVSSDKFLIRDRGSVFLSFKDILGVVYQKYPFNIDKNTLAKATLPINTSSLIDTGGEDFEIYADGNISNPDQLIFQDDWAKHKLSVLLPLDYEPEL